jgi:hypothetical protein
MFCCMRSADETAGRRASRLVERTGAHAHVFRRGFSTDEKRNGADGQQAKGAQAGRKATTEHKPNSPARHAPQPTVERQKRNLGDSSGLFLDLRCQWVWDASEWRGRAGRRRPRRTKRGDGFTGPKGLATCSDDTPARLPLHSFMAADSGELQMGAQRRPRQRTTSEKRRTFVQSRARSLGSLRSFISSRLYTAQQQERKHHRNWRLQPWW